MPLIVAAAGRGRNPAPVAVMIFGGLISATLLDALLTPVLFLALGRKPLERIMVGRAAAGEPLTHAEAY